MVLIFTKDCCITNTDLKTKSEDYSVIKEVIIDSARILSTRMKSIQNIVKEWDSYMISRYHPIYHLVISNITNTLPAPVMGQPDIHMPHDEML